MTNLTHNSFFYVFISILYMFRATPCSSSGESILSIQHLVCVTLCRWPSSMQVYMFRATSCSSSGESIVSIQHLVCVTLCRWLSSMQVYVFRATSCSSSGESIASIQHLVCVTLCGWRSSMHTRQSPTQSGTYQRLYWYNWFSWWWARSCSKHVDLHTRRSPTQSDTYQMLYWCNWFSWWARGCSKHVENWNKHIEKGVPSWPAYQTATYTEWHISDVVLIQLILLMMSTSLLEICRELKWTYRKRSSFPTSIIDGHLHSDTYQMYWYNWFSWWWARGYSKHVENWNEHIGKELRVKLVIYRNYTEMAARSSEHKIMKYCLSVNPPEAPVVCLHSTLNENCTFLYFTGNLCERHPVTCKNHVVANSEIKLMWHLGVSTVRPDYLEISYNVLGCHCVFW
jgi:hypothetical protein